MPRQSVQFIQSVSNKGLIPLDDIPDDVKALVEEIYEKQRKSDGRTRLAYDTADELALEFKQMVSYGAQRKQGALKIRKSPTHDLPDTQMDIRVAADVEANGQRKATNGGSRRQS